MRELKPILGVVTVVFASAAFGLSEEELAKATRSHVADRRRT